MSKSAEHKKVLLCVIYTSVLSVKEDVKSLALTLEVAERHILKTTGVQSALHIQLQFHRQRLNQNANSQSLNRSRNGQNKNDDSNSDWYFSLNKAIIY